MELSSKTSFSRGRDLLVAVYIRVLYIEFCNIENQKLWFCRMVAWAQTFFKKNLDSLITPPL
jgi:hypothetical protein